VLENEKSPHKLLSRSSSSEQQASSGNSNWKNEDGSKHVKQFSY